MSIFNQAVTRLRPTTRTTRGGDEVSDWSSPRRDAIDGLSVQPNASRQDGDDTGVLRITGYRVLSRPGHVPDITGHDRIEYRDRVYRVDGDVALWPDPHGRDHIEFTMTTYEGG